MTSHNFKDLLHAAVASVNTLQITAIKYDFSFYIAALHTYTQTVTNGPPWRRHTHPSVTSHTSESVDYGNGQLCTKHYRSLFIEVVA